MRADAPRFLNEWPLRVKTCDGHNCSLLEFLKYRAKDGSLYRTRTDTDGMSTPPFLWWFLPPFGRVWYSAILHDGAYRCSLERYSWENLAWEEVELSEAAANDLLSEAMKSQGASWYEIFIVWINLHWFGWRAFEEDRRAYLKAEEQVKKAVRAPSTPPAE